MSITKILSSGGSHFSYFVIFWMVFMCFACIEQEKAEENNTDTQKSIYQYECEVYRVNETNEEWGYKINRDGEPFIVQSTIPAVSGNKGFRNKEDARKVAELVIHKLENNANTALLPSVSINELDSLKIEKD